MGTSIGVWGARIVVAESGDATGVNTDEVTLWRGSFKRQENNRIHFSCVNTEHNDFPNCRFECNGVLNDHRLTLRNGSNDIVFTKVLPEPALPHQQSAGPRMQSVPGNEQAGSAASASGAVEDKKASALR